MFNSSNFFPDAAQKIARSVSLRPLDSIPEEPEQNLPCLINEDARLDALSSEILTAALTHATAKADFEKYLLEINNKKISIFVASNNYHENVQSILKLKTLSIETKNLKIAKLKQAPSLIPLEDDQKLATMQKVFITADINLALLRQEYTKLQDIINGINEKTIPVNDFSP